MDEAVQLAQACPILAYGAQIEVRPIADLNRMLIGTDSVHEREHFQ